jgi:hypothetical protein
MIRTAIYGRHEARIRESRIPPTRSLGLSCVLWIGVSGVQTTCSSLTGGIQSRVFRRYAEPTGRTPVSRDPRFHGAYSAPSDLPRQVAGEISFSPISISVSSYCAAC